MESTAATWLNLMTMGSSAWAKKAHPRLASKASAKREIRHIIFLPVWLLRGRIENRSCQEAINGSVCAQSKAYCTKRHRDTENTEEEFLCVSVSLCKLFIFSQIRGTTPLPHGLTASSARTDVPRHPPPPHTSPGRDEC